jgi:hypothetical protein
MLPPMRRVQPRMGSPRAHAHGSSAARDGSPMLLDGASFATPHCVSLRGPAAGREPEEGTGARGCGAEQAPTTAVQRVQRLVQRRQERDAWKMERRHLDALRTASELAVAAGALLSGRPPAAGRSVGSRARQPDKVALTQEQRWQLLTDSFANNDLENDGTVPNAVFVKVLAGLDLFLGKDETLELLAKYECTDKRRVGRSDYAAFLKNIRRLIFAAPGLAQREAGVPGEGAEGAEPRCPEDLHGATTVTWREHHAAAAHGGDDVSLEGRGAAWWGQPVDGAVLKQVHERADIYINLRTQTQTRTHTHTHTHTHTNTNTPIYIYV